MTVHVSRMEGRRAEASVARFLRHLSGAFAGIRFILPAEEDAELERVERLARAMVNGKAGLPPRCARPPRGGTAAHDPACCPGAGPAGAARAVGEAARLPRPRGKARGGCGRGRA